MIKNVIRQLNVKIEQKQQAVAAAAQTDVAHMTRMKEVHIQLASLFFVTKTVVSDSSF
jgi:hypothetical protein